MDGELRFEVLGPVRAWRGPHELDLGAPQQRAILAVLLLRAGTPATPDQLVSAIWGGAAPRAAAGVVRSYVSRLRQVLPPGVIESTGGGYVVAAARLDLTEFGHQLAVARQAGHPDDAAAALRAALALWHGAPLAGVNGDYAEFERTRLTQLRLAAVEDLAAADLAAGRHGDAAELLAEVIAEQPLRERPRELLMLALYRAGRQADALAVFAEVQHLLADQLGLDPGPGLREMQRRILAADPDLLGPAPAAGPVAAAATADPDSARLAGPSARPAVAAPAQLPPDLPDFVGRADLLATLTATLTPSAAEVPVLGIEGLAGIGKTTLAVHAGHRLADRFPDGQLFVDLAATADPLAALLRALDATDLPDSTAERAALWRSSTAGRRLLVVLDDARAADQLRTLLPGAGGAAVLVTARRRLYDAPHVRWLRLPALAPDESRALFGRLVGADRVQAEPAAAHLLVDGTAGLPQVLAAIGARIASRPEWTLTAALDRIGKLGPDAPVQRPECAAIERPFESLLADLTAPQARAFRLLALADGPDISLGAAAALLDLPAATAATLLDSLVDLHLVEPGGLDRYALPGPLRHFARGRADVDDGPAVTQAALTRLVRHYSTESGTVPA